MIILSEFLPNPPGADRGGEWIELHNTGAAAVSLSGWSVRAGNGQARLSGSIAPGGYNVFNASALGLTLKNTDGSVTLTGPGGEESVLSFIGAAPDGQSVQRASGDIGVFGSPTPGQAALVADTNTTQEPGIFFHALSGWSVAGFAIVVGILAAGAWLYGIKKNESIAQHFFGGN